MRRLSVLVFCAACALLVSACGGDNLDLCDGCTTPTLTPVVSVTPTAATPTITTTPGTPGVGMVIGMIAPTPGR